jgi:hypothetical protein
MDCAVRIACPSCSYIKAIDDYYTGIKRLATFDPAKSHCHRADVDGDGV